MAIKNLSFKKKALPKKHYTAMKKTKVWRCIVVLVILAGAMSVAVLGMNSINNATEASNRSNATR